MLALLLLACSDKSTPDSAPLADFPPGDICATSGDWSVTWTASSGEIGMRWGLSPTCTSAGMALLDVDVQGEPAPLAFEHLGGDLWRYEKITDEDEQVTVDITWTTHSEQRYDIQLLDASSFTGEIRRAYTCTAGDCDTWNDYYSSVDGTSVEEGPTTGAAP